MLSKCCWWCGNFICQKKCALLLLSTVIIWGLYLHLLQFRMILYQLCEGQHTSPHNDTIRSEKSGVPFCFKCTWSSYLPKMFWGQFHRIAFWAGVYFKDENNGHLLACLHLVPLSCWNVRNACNSSWGYCLVFGIHLDRFLFRLLPALFSVPSPQPQHLFRDPWASILHCNLTENVYFQRPWISPSMMDILSQAFHFGYHLILTDWHLKFRERLLALDPLTFPYYSWLRAGSTPSSADLLTYHERGSAPMG